MRISLLANQFRTSLVSLVRASLCLGATACNVGQGELGVGTRVYVEGSGLGSGSVGASVANLYCEFEAGVFKGPPPGDSNMVCHSTFKEAGGGGVFRIYAEPDSGSMLAGWSGDCSGMICIVSFEVGASISAKVRFERAGTPAPVVLSDSFAVGDQWDFRVLASTGAATQLPVTSATGGDPDGFRRMEHRIDGVGNIQVFHRFTGATYSPSTSGAIASLSYSEHRIVLDPPFLGAGVASGFALEQGGQVYTLSFGGYTNVRWQRFERAQIVASDFSPAPGPDLSASGGPIRFGFIRGNSNTSTGLQRIHHGIDNWRVEIHRR